MNKFVLVSLFSVMLACQPKLDPPTTLEPSVTATDAGQSNVADGGTPSPAVDDSGVSSPTTQAECVAVCEAKYPTAAAENKLLDSCMLGPICGTVCNDLGTSKDLVSPSVDAGVACDTDKANSWKIATTSILCSNCLAQNCCHQWIAIYGDTTQGQPLSTCSDGCFSSFKN